jgi:thioredoxin reductase (NADPH)
MKYDTIIIGAGPAGLTAALYSYRYSLKTLVISKDLGGTALEAHSIENFPGYKNITGINLMKSWIDHIKSLKIEIHQDDVINIEKIKDIFEITTKNGKKFQTKTVILALGMKRKKLNIENEDKFLGHGISYCTICDAPIYKNKIVAVIGGGNSALIDAQLLSQYAKKVYLIHRRDEFKAEPKREQDTKKNKKVEIIYNANVKQIKGTNFVKSIFLDNKTELKIDGIFIDIGFIPSVDIIKKLDLKCDKHDYIIVNNKQETNIPGLFAAGDITFNPLKQIITAAAEGAISAFSAFKFIKNE